MHSPTTKPLPHHTESDANFSSRRATWYRDSVGEASLQLIERDSNVFLRQSASSPCLSAVRSVQGVWIEDYDGRKYLDFHGNNAHHIGHAHPRLIREVTEQMQQLTFAPRRFTSEPAIELAEKLVEVTPSGLDRVLFAPSGSDAVEMALAYARAVTGRFKTISFWESYHGAGFGARSLGGEQMFHSSPIGPLLPGTEHVPPYGDYRNAWGVREGSGELCLRTIRYVLETQGDVCAVVAEPMRACPVPPPPGFWKEVRKACDEYGALLIFDEIPTGLGKTGRMFSCEHEDVVPDMLVLGKALGGGMLPIAALVASEEMDVCSHLSYGHFTHEKNPVTTQAALSTLNIIEDEGLVENARVIGEKGLSRLRELQSRHELIGDVRGRGCVWGVELVFDRETRQPASDAADAVLYAALNRGLSFKVMNGNVLVLTPPLVLNEEQLEQGISILDDALTEVSNSR